MIGSHIQSGTLSGEEKQHYPFPALQERPRPAWVIRTKHVTAERRPGNNSADDWFVAWLGEVCIMIGIYSYMYRLIGVASSTQHEMWCISSSVWSNKPTCSWEHAWLCFKDAEEFDVHCTVLVKLPCQTIWCLCQVQCSKILVQVLTKVRFWTEIQIAQIRYWTEVFSSTINGSLSVSVSPPPRVLIANQVAYNLSNF